MCAQACVIILNSKNVKGVLEPTVLDRNLIHEIYPDGFRCFVVSDQQLAAGAYNKLKRVKASCVASIKPKIRITCSYINYCIRESVTCLKYFICEISTTGSKRCSYRRQILFLNSDGICGGTRYLAVTIFFIVLL